MDVSDPDVRAALQAARAWGVPLSTFLGAQARTVTSTNGVTSVSVADPLWSDDDRRLAVELMAWEADLCPGCRQPLAETTRPEMEEQYVAAVAARCHRCTAIEQATEVVKDRPQASALLIGVQVRGEPDGHLG